MHVRTPSVSPELLSDVTLAQRPQVWREGRVESQEAAVEDQHLPVPR